MGDHVKLAFLWHLHQPDYRDPVGCGDMTLPWVRLHGTRGYTDLGWILERHPEVHATVNLTPILVEQLDGLVRGAFGDRFLDLSARRAEDLTLAEQVEILRGFFRVDWEAGARPLPRYWELLHQRGRDLKSLDLERVVREFSAQDFRDLQVLFNLSWMGFAARTDEDVVKNLLTKGGGFTEVEKDVLLQCQARVLAEVLPRWKRLADRGQVELTTTPYYHPILPLVCDTDAARRALPDAALPPRTARPGDARIQVAKALEAHARIFGARPAGMWPAEGSVSPEAVAILAEAGVRWCASDEDVLFRSELDGEATRADLYRTWAVDAGDREIAMVFRDRTLSDLIGFSYATNPAQEAVTDFLRRVTAIAREVPADPPPLVPVILDGENPWERYPDSGRAFLDQLHQALARGNLDGVRIESTTLGDAVAAAPPARRIRRLHSGSWIQASYAIWIGHPETNLAWQLLCEAGSVFDAHSSDLAEQNRAEAREHLLAAEGSDWFWWYGEDFVSENPEVFDELFRAHLIKVYELTGQATPQRLRIPISEAALGGLAASPLREPTRMVTPVIDGTAAPFVDWYGAGVYRPGHGAGSMFQASARVAALYYGIDPTELFLRLDPTPEGARLEGLGTLRLELAHGERTWTVEAPLVRGPETTATYEGEPLGRVCFGDIVEVSVPFERLGLPGGERVRLAVHLRSEAVEIERLPRYGHLTLTVPAPGTGQRDWRA